MKYRDKLLVQIMMCLSIFAVLRGLAMVDSDGFTKIKNTLDGYLSKNYSVDEIKESGAELVDKITGAPSALVNAVIEANEINEFGVPMDEKDTDGIQAVHAVAGGVVTYSGIDKDLGLCIKIQHEGKLSTYGNMDSINAVTGDRVKKGTIIGTFNKKSGQDFYYQLTDSVV